MVEFISSNYALLPDPFWLQQHVRVGTKNEKRKKKKACATAIYVPRQKHVAQMEQLLYMLTRGCIYYRDNHYLT